MTWSPDFPTTRNSFDPSFNGKNTSNAFITKFDPTGTGLIYSTFIGEGAQGHAISLDSYGAAYVAGQVERPSIPLTPDSFDATFNGIYDGFLVKINSLGNAVDYGTYFGGSGTDCEIGGDNRESDIATDNSGYAFIAGGTNSANFPITDISFDDTYNGGTSDGFAIKLATGQITVDDKMPLAYIILPKEEVTIQPNTPIFLQGYAYDLEDGILGEDYLSWSSSLDGELGMGSKIFVSLSPGQHIITLSAVDSDGNMTTAKLDLFAGYKIFLPLISDNP